MKRLLTSALALLLSLSLCASLLPGAAAEGEPFYDYPYQTYDPDTTHFGLSRFVDGEEITVLPKEYDYIGIFRDGTAIVQKNTDTYGSTFGLVDYNGSFILPVEYGDLSRGSYDEADNILRARKIGEDFYRYLRPDGTPLTDYTFTACSDFCRHIGVGCRSIDGKALYGAVNDRGEILIPFEYDLLDSPHPSYYSWDWLSAQKDGCFGAFDYNGNLLRRCIYPDHGLLLDSLFLPAQMTEEEERGHLITSAQCWEIAHYPNGFSPELWGYTFQSNTALGGQTGWAITPRFLTAQPFDETGHAQVTCGDGRMGTIDQSGNFTPAPLNDRFSDVLSGSWYDQGVTTCAERGVMVGTGEGRFSPAAQLSDPECLTMALRLYDLQRGGDGTLEKAPEDAEGLPGADRWYRDAVYTARQWGLDSADGFDVLVNRSTSLSGSGSTSRDTFAQALTVAAGELPKKYDVVKIPDVERTEYNQYLYGLYEAGILNGTDSFGTFQADKELTRAECAVMVSRVLDPAQRLTEPPATPNGYEQAVIDLRTGFTYIEESETVYDTDDCTIFVYDRGGAMHTGPGNVSIIYKPGSQPGDGIVLRDLQTERPYFNLSSQRGVSTARLSEDRKTFTCTYRVEAPVEYEGETLLEAGVYTYTVDLPAGKTATTYAPFSYENSLELLVNERNYTVEKLIDTDDYGIPPEEGCSVVLRWKPLNTWDDTKDYELWVVRKDSAGTCHRLLLPSTSLGKDGYERPTDRAPDRLDISPDGKTLTYKYHFSLPLEHNGEVLHETGDYIYTADLSTGDVTANVDVLSQLNVSYYGTLGSLKSEEGYVVDDSFPSYRITPATTLLRYKAAEGDQTKRDYELYLLYRAASPQLYRLALPSTEVLPDGSAPTTRAPDTLQFSDDDATLTYTYRFTEPLWNGDTLLHDKGTYIYTVDIASARQSVELVDAYEKALEDAIQTGGTWRVDERLETPLCTILVQHSDGFSDDKGFAYPGASVTLIFKDGSPNGVGEVVDLPVLSGTLRYGSIPPHHVSLNEDKTVFTYVYQFDENQYAHTLSGLSYLNLKAGTYTYTVDLAAGTVEETIKLKEE